MPAISSFGRKITECRLSGRTGIELNKLWSSNCLCPPPSIHPLISEDSVPSHPPSKVFLTPPGRITSALCDDPLTLDMYLCQPPDTLVNLYISSTAP